MQDTTHKRTKTAVPRLVVVLVFCLYVAMTLPSTTAALITVTRLEIFYIALFRPDEVNVTSKDQLEFRGLNEDLKLRIQFSASCSDDLVDDGVEVKDSTAINVNSLFSKTTSKTAYAAFENVGCKPGNTVKINLLGHVTPPKAPKNSTESSTNAKNSTSSEDEHDRTANATTSRADEDSPKVSNSTHSSAHEIGHGNNHEKVGLSPTMAAVIGSGVTFAFASVFAIGFLIYRRRTGAAAAANDPGGKDDEPLTANRDVPPDSPDSKEPIPYHPTVISNAEASPKPHYPMMISNAEASPKPHYPMMISNAEAPPNAYYPMPRNAYPMVISNAEAPPSPYLAVISNGELLPNAYYPTVISNAEAPPNLYPTAISNAEALPNAYPTVISNAEALPNAYPTVTSNAEALPNPCPTVISDAEAVTSNAEAPPVYDDVVPRFVSYQTTSSGEAGGSDTNHEVITDSNFEAEHTSIDT